MLLDKIAACEVRAHSKFTKGVALWCTQVARSAIAINAENVEEYAHELGALRSSDIPCAAPPFDFFAIESTTDRGAWCWVFSTVEFADNNEWQRFDDKTGISSFHNDDVRWSMSGMLFVRIKGQLTAFATREIILDDNGGYIGSSQKAVLSADGTYDENDGIRADWLAAVALLTIGFMHCKNVVQRVVAPPPRLAKRYKERHGRPMFSYRVLEIDPMAQVLRTEGGIDTVGARRALHICRGHFKDYRERGLFGRTHGLFWWDQHLRGTLEAGIAAKDYRVKAPQ